MNTREQAHHFGSKGFYGSVGVQFGLNNSLSEMDVVVKDNHFVHFYDLPREVLEDDKHVIVMTNINLAEHLEIVSDIVTKVSETLTANSSFSFIHVVDDKVFLWSSTSNDDSQTTLVTFIQNLAESSHKKLTQASATDLEDIFRDQDKNVNSVATHLFYFKSKQTSNNQDQVREYFDPARLSKVSVVLFSEEDLNQFRNFLDKKVRIEYKGDLVDEGSLTETQFSSVPEGGHLVVAGRLIGSVRAGVIVAQVSTLFGMETLTYPLTPCSGHVTLCHQKKCSEYTESVPSLPAGLTVSAQAGNCLWTLHSQRNYLGDSKTLTQFPLHNGDFMLRSIKKQNIFYQENEESNLIDSLQVNSVERLHDFMSVQNAMEKIAGDDKLDEEKVKKAEKISLKNNFLTPFTQLVLKGEDSKVLTYSYDDLISPLLSQNPHPGHQTPRSSSCPPLSITSPQEGEVLISGSHPNINLGAVTQASQTGTCCWLLFSLPFYGGEVEQFCGGEDSVSLVKIGSVKTL